MALHLVARLLAVTLAAGHAPATATAPAPKSTPPSGAATATPPRSAAPSGTATAPAPESATSTGSAPAASSKDTAATFGFALPVPFFFPVPTSPLLRAARELRCAYVEDDARRALAVLRDADTSALGLPDEELGGPGPKHLYAATVDVLLDSFLVAADRFPKLRRDIEAVPLSWDYCQANRDSTPWDLALEDGHVVRRPPVGPFPLSRKGFVTWGFTREDPPDRYAPDLVLRPGLGHDQTILFLHALRQERCFPDAWNGATPFDVPPAPLTPEQPPPAAPIAATDKTPYPYVLAACPPPPPPPPNPLKVAGGKWVVGAVGGGGTRWPKPGSPEALASMAGSSVVAGGLTGASEKAQKPPQGFAAASGSVLGFSAPGVRRLQGTVLLASPLNGESPYVGVSAVVTPYSYFFVRGGLNYPIFGNPTRELSNSWGLGYDDWHPNTFSVQLNRWDPKSFSKGFNLENAVLNIGYKPPQPCLGKFCLSSFVFVDVPYTLDPSLGVRATVTFMTAWFVMGGVSYNLLKEPHVPRFSYGIGRSDWRPFTFSVNYFNWGPDPDWRQGVVSGSFSWAF